MTGNQYKFSGKELDTEGGLDWYYFGARYYDPVIARWLSVDPLAGKYLGYSPYNYVLNNPLISIDPDGRSGGYFGIRGIFAGGIVNAHLSLNLMYDWRSIYLTGTFGFGGTGTKGVFLDADISAGSFSGDVPESSSSVYFMGSIGDAVTASFKGAVPTSDINKVHGILPKYTEMMQMRPTSDLSVGVGGGAALMVGVEHTGTLLKFGGNVKDSMNLNNQKGQAPSDATNVGNVYSPLDSDWRERKYSEKKAKKLLDQMENPRPPFSSSSGE